MVKPNDPMRGNCLCALNEYAIFPNKIYYFLLLFVILHNLSHRTNLLGDTNSNMINNLMEFIDT